MGDSCVRIWNDIHDMGRRWHATHAVNPVTSVVTMLSMLAMASLVFVTSRSVADEYATSAIVTDLHDTDVRRTEDAMVNVYLFWGDGCKHCDALMGALWEIAARHPGVFRVYGLETWHDDENESLLERYSGSLGLPDRKVPLLFVGDKVFQGYDAGVDSQIEGAIMSEYGKLVKEDVWRYE